MSKLFPNKPLAASSALNSWEVAFLTPASQSTLGNMDDLRVYTGALTKEAIHSTSDI